MKAFKSTLAASLLAASVAAGALAAFVTPAAADVACNRYGECWRVKERYTTYPSDLRVTFHDDAWREHHGKGAPLAQGSRRRPGVLLPWAVASVRPLGQAANAG